MKKDYIQFEKDDLNDFDSIVKSKMITAIISHLFIAILFIFASFIISFQFIGPEFWKQLVVGVAISFIPVYKIYEDLRDVEHECNQVYSYFISHKDEIMKEFEDCNDDEEIEN